MIAYLPLLVLAATVTFVALAIRHGRCDCAYCLLRRR